MNECACGWPLGDLLQRSRVWHEDHKAHHLATFPCQKFNRATVENLDWLIRLAEEREGSAA